jgi:hypothetical protein
MAGLSADQEPKLVEALIALGWRNRLEAESCTAIMQILNCSSDDAKEIIEQLYIKRGLIRQVSSIGEELDSVRSRPRGRCRWIAN